jgi:cytochrome c oxidase subunit I
MTTSPPKEHNFDSIVTVSHLDEFFHRKYAEDANGNMVKVATGEEILADQIAHADKHIHMPSPCWLSRCLSLRLELSSARISPLLAVPSA